MPERSEVFRLVNAERESNGVPLLNWNDSLAEAAQIRARELKTSFSHMRPDGTTFYTALAQSGIRTRAWGENIAQGQPDAASVMNSWMNSRGHRGNILDRDFQQMAVGAFPCDPFGMCWVQLFIK
jgi:uncharacterized protein YkwD